MNIGEINRDQSYYDLIISKEIKGQEEAVFRAIFSYPDSTDRELSDLSGIDRSSVNGRRNDLVNDGLVVASGSKVDVTGRVCTTWRVKLEADTPKEIEHILSNSEMNKIEKLLLKANTYQKEKIKRLLE